MTQKKLADDCFVPGQDRLRHADAIALLRDRTSAVAGVERVRVDAAAGRVLAETAAARMPVPAHTNAAVDGYSFASTDYDRTAGAILPVGGRAAAGHALSAAPASGSAARIFTGATLPDGHDTVVMQEDVETVVVGGTAGVRIPGGLKSGANRRKAGEDVAAGTTLLAIGDLLRPQDLAALASIGFADVAVYKRLEVAVLSTGDEIVASGPLSPGKIRDSNRPMLLAMLHEAGCDAVDLGIAEDDEGVIFDRIAQATLSCDALLTSGAVSVGDYDFVKVAIERLAHERGGQYNWQQVAIKPAKPLAFATITNGVRDVAIFGLPGNPVSSHVSFELFARPVLRRMMGHTEHAQRPVVHCIAASPMTRRVDGKVHLDRVRVWTDDGVLMCERSGAQASNVLSGMANALGLAVLDDGVGAEAGGRISVMLLTDL